MLPGILFTSTFAPQVLVADQAEILRNWILRKTKTIFYFFLKPKKRSKPLKPYLSVDISECASSVNAEAKLTQLPIVLCHESLAFLARSLATQVEIPPETETETEKQRDERKN
jgi:hypothetical protein